MLGVAPSELNAGHFPGYFLSHTHTHTEPVERSMTMWLYFTSCKAPRRHEAAKNTPPGVNQSSAGTFHRAWMQSQTLASQHRRDTRPTTGCPRQQGRNKVGQCGPAEGGTHLSCRRWLRRRCAESWTRLRRPATRKTSACRSASGEREKKNKTTMLNLTITIETLYIYKCFQYSPAQARGG